MSKKYFAILAAALVSCSLFTGGKAVAAAGDDFPTRPIRMVVAYGPGGGTDRAIRMFQPYFEKALGQKIVVGNMGGGGTEIATTSVANKPADGYTILVTNQPDLNWTLAFQSPAGYDENTFELMMISQIDPRIIIAAKNSPYTTFTDFIEDAKKKPGKLAVSVGQNSGVHALALYLRKALNVDYKVVPYDGGGQAAAALIGNQVDLAIGDAFSRLNLRDSVKCIAVMGSERSKIWPEGEPLDPQLKPYGVSVPTLNRYQVFAAKREFRQQYPQRYQKLINAFKAASQDPEYLALIRKNFMEDIEVWLTGDQVVEDLKQQVAFLRTEIKPLLNQK